MRLIVMPLNEWKFRKSINADYNLLNTKTLKILNLSHARLYNNLIVSIESEISNTLKSHDYTIIKNI